MARAPDNLPAVVPPQTPPRGSWDRKVKFSMELVEEIARRHGDGETLTSITRGEPERMPTMWTLYEWEQLYDDVHTLFERARLMYAATLAQEIRDIADNVNIRETREVTYENKKPNKIKIGYVDQVERDKLRVAVRQNVLNNYLNHPGRKDDPPGGEQAETDLGVRIIGGLPDE